MSNFTAELEIKDFLFSWTNISDFQKIVEEKYLKAKFKICRAFTDFGQCFKDEVNYKACTQDIMGLIIDEKGKQTSVDPIGARNFLKYMGHMSFACGSGFSLYHSYPNQIQAVFQNNRTTLDECDEKLEININPTVEKSCINAESVIKCYEDVFASQGGVAGWWGCSYARYGILRGVAPHCNFLVCTGTFAPV
uniref:Uncharacterized protein n=1 Tax=Setaria digitata TaxID=48799 RepID=A0A915PT52_9BILA